jgi:hypothetical protein
VGGSCARGKRRVFFRADLYYITNTTPRDFGSKLAGQRVRRSLRAQQAVNREREAVEVWD